MARVRVNGISVTMSDAEATALQQDFVKCLGKLGGGITRNYRGPDEGESVWLWIPASAAVAIYYDAQPGT